MISRLQALLILAIFATKVLWASETVDFEAENSVVDANSVAKQLQELDSSSLEFDFFEEKSVNRNEQDTLFRALELLDQSTKNEPDVYLENTSTFDEEYSNGAFIEGHGDMSKKMDEELESAIEHEISEEIDGILNDIEEE